MFNETFFRFSIGFAAIICFGMGTLYLASLINDSSKAVETAASVR